MNEREHDEAPGNDHGAGQGDRSKDEQDVREAVVKDDGSEKDQQE